MYFRHRNEEEKRPKRMIEKRERGEEERERGDENIFWEIYFIV